MTLICCCCIVSSAETVLEALHRSHFQKWRGAAYNSITKCKLNIKDSHGLGCRVSISCDDFIVFVFSGVVALQFAAMRNLMDELEDEMDDISKEQVSERCLSYVISLN